VEVPRLDEAVNLYVAGNSTTCWWNP